MILSEAKPTFEQGKFQKISILFTHQIFTKKNFPLIHVYTSLLETCRQLVIERKQIPICISNHPIISSFAEDVVNTLEWRYFWHARKLFFREWNKSLIKFKNSGDRLKLNSFLILSLASVCLDKDDNLQTWERKLFFCCFHKSATEHNSTPTRHVSLIYRFMENTCFSQVAHASNLSEE